MVNETKKRSPQAWNKWLMSGAIAGVSYEPGPRGFVTLTFSHRVNMNEAIALHKKCAIVHPTIIVIKVADPVFEGPSSAPEHDSLPEPFERVPGVGYFDDRVQLSWFGDRNYHDFGSASLMRD